MTELRMVSMVKIGEHGRSTEEDSVESIGRSESKSGLQLTERHEELTPQTK